MDAAELPDGITAVVFDTTSGAIKHVHEEVTLAGRRAPPPNQVAARALRNAAAFAGRPRPLDPRTLKTLVVPASHVHVAGELRVDPKLVRLVPIR